MSAELVLVALLIVFMIIAISLGRRRERQRTIQMEASAARLGLTFQEEDPSISFSRLSLFTTGSVRIRNVAKGEVRGCEVVVVDHQCIRGFGEAATRHAQSVCAFRVAGLGLPAFSLSAGSARGRDIKFESHPQFARDYRLTGADEAAIRRLFGKEVLDFFTSKERTSAESDGEWVIVYRANRLVSAEDLEFFLESAIQVRDILEANARKEAADGRDPSEPLRTGRERPATTLKICPKCGERNHLANLWCGCGYKLTRVGSKPGGASN